ncbi:hypothetical protein, partial [uncultured Alistipes sp.]
GATEFVAETSEVRLFFYFCFHFHFRIFFASCGSIKPRGPQPWGSGGPPLRCRFVRALRRLRPTVANRRDRKLRPGFTASFPHFGCAAAAPARQNARKLAFTHDFS